jgi:hypothetical protein
MKKITTLALVTALLASAASSAWATPTMSVSGYSQNFNGMGTGTTLPDGWSVRSISGGHDTFTPTDDPVRGSSPTVPTGAAILGGSSVATTAATPGTQRAATGFNWAVGGSTTERSLGTSPTGVAGMVLELRLINGTGAALTSLDIDYDVRTFSTTTNNNNYSNAPYTGKEELPGYWLFYSLDNGATYTNLSSLNADGKTWANSAGTVHESVTDYALNGTWAPGSEIRFRWFDDNAQGPSPDQLIGLDNLTLTPEPATLSLLGLGGLALLRRRRNK